MTAPTESLDEVREFFRDELDAANYPAKDIDVIEREPGNVELVAILLRTSADARELDGIVTRLESRPPIENASWNLRPTE